MVGLEASKVRILLIDEVDLQLCNSPQLLKNLLDLKVEIVGFSASMQFTTGGEALHFMKKNKIPTLGVDLGEVTEPTIDDHITED